MPSGMLRDVRALEVLEVLGTPEARAVVDRAASGAPDAPFTLAAKASLARMPKRAGPTR